MGVGQLVTGGSPGSGGGGGGIGAAGVVFCIRIPIGFADATYTSAHGMPAGAVVLRAFVDVTKAFVAETPTIELGTTLDGATAFMGNADSAPAVIGLYDAPQDTPTLGGPLLVTIGGTPSDGAGFACVEYTAAFS